MFLYELESKLITTFPRPSLFVFVLDFLLVLSCTGAEANNADMLVEKYLPANSLHHFTALDKNWRAQIENLDKPRSDGLVVLVQNRKGISDEKYAKETYSKLITYFDQTNANQPVKEVDYDHHGNITREIDWKVKGKIVQEEFWRDLYPNGDLDYYQHLQNGRIVSELSVNPITKHVEVIKNGQGMLTSYDSKGIAVKREWLTRGQIFAERYFNNKAYTKIILYAQGDSLTVDKESQLLMLGERKECWHGSKDGREASFQPFGNAQHPDVLEMPEYPFGHADENKIRVVKENWAKVYSQRRSDFLNRFNLILNEAGLTDKDLGIEFIEEGKPWPGSPSHALSIIDSCNQDISLNPKDAEAYEKRGNAYFDKHEWKNAFADYSKAININPKYKEAYCDRAYAYYERGKQENDENEDVRLGLAENPKTPQHILKTLAADQNMYVSSRASKSLSG